MADPITPEDRSRNLAAARALIMKGGPGGVVPRDTALMIIDVAETAGIDCARLAKKITALSGTLQRLDEEVLLNSVGVKLVKRLRVGLTAVKDIAECATADQFLNEVGAKAALQEILAVIEGVTK